MKTKILLVLLFSLSFIYGGATPQEKVKNIHLKKNATSNGKIRSAAIFASAYLSLNNEKLFINLENYSKDVTITVTNRSTDEILYSALHSASNDIVLNMNGLLEEGSDYRLEIIIGETILYGEFNI